jgi:hypothetical protein
MPNGQAFSTGTPAGDSITVSGANGLPIQIGANSPRALQLAASSAASAATASTGISNFNAGNFRKAEAENMGTIINLTVNGAFDKEGTARTIVETLNSSAYRGTGGAGNLVAI